MEKTNMKVVTLCGSFKFKDDMMRLAEEMTLNGECILTPVYHVLNDKIFTKKEISNLKQSHLKRIEMSDAIFVINKNKYIGDSTRKEIEYAKKIGKEIRFLEY